MCTTLQQNSSTRQFSSSVTRLGDLLDFGQLLKGNYFATTTQHIQAIFVKVSKSQIFLVISFLGNFYRHLATFLLVTRQLVLRYNLNHSNGFEAYRQIDGYFQCECTKKTFIINVYVSILIKQSRLHYHFKIKTMPKDGIIFCCRVAMACLPFLQQYILSTKCTQSLVLNESCCNCDSWNIYFREHCLCDSLHVIFQKFQT